MSIHHGTHLLTTPRTRGVAFRVDVIDSSRPGTFLLTAAHLVQAEARNKAPVDVWVAGEPEPRAAEVLGCGYAPEEPDLALLYLEPAIGPPLRLSEEVQPGAESVLRGAAAAGDTELSSFKACILGSEMFRGRRVLDLLLDFHLERDRLECLPADAIWRPPRNEEHSALGGISGAPAEVRSAPGTGSVVGIIFRRNESGLGGRIYAESIESAASAVRSFGFILVRESRAFVAVDVMRDLAAPLMRSSLGDVEGVHALWEVFSSSFYAGAPIDDFLRELLRRPHEYELGDPFHLAQIKFLLSRLLLKRGSAEEAEALLRDVSRFGPDRSPDHGYLAAVAKLRLLVERWNQDDLADRGDLLKRALDVIEDGDAVSSDLRAYEMASAIGKEALVTAQLLPAHHEEPLVRQRIDELTTTHTVLLEEHRAALGPKQEVVSLALLILGALWNPARDPLAQGARLGELARRGRVAARQRENAIFFCQMLLVEAVAATHRADLNPFAPALLASDLLRRGGLRLHHEGVSQVVDYLRTFQPALYAAISATFELGLERGLGSLESGTALGLAELRELRDAVEPVRDTVSGAESLKDVFDIPLTLWLPGE